MSDLSIETLSLSGLKPWPRNARTHSKKQIKQIAESITQFGFTNPMLVDRDNTILAGHGRVAAAKLLELSEVPCVRLEHMTQVQKRAYVLADNKLALNAGWNEELLAEELEAILSEDKGFDISITGCSLAEVDSQIEGKAVEEDGDLNRPGFTGDLQPD
jgi:ParB-like chromosome segregation protein Spo0J